MFLNVEQLEKQLDKEDFQEIGSIAAFNLLYTIPRQTISEFRDTSIQHLESVKKSIDERVQLKREYDSWKAVGHNQKSMIQAADQEMMHMMRMQISDPYTMKSQWLRSKSTANGSKPMPRRNTQTSRNWPASKNSFVMIQTVPIAEHPRNSRNDSCVTKFLKEVNSHAKAPSNKTTNRNKPVEQKGVPNKQERQIITGHRFSIQKTSVVQKKTMTPRSCLRWKPTGKIFKIVGLRWVPTGRILTSSTTKVNSEPLNGSNADITNQHECEQTLDVSAGFKEFSSDVQAMTSDHNSSELELHDHISEQSSSKLVPDIVPPADKTATSRQVLELLFHHHITMLRNLPKDTPYLEIAVLKYDGDECDKGIMQTKIELTLEQSQQGVSNDVLVSIEGVKELKRNVWIKGENKAALHYN
nr:hypothetical protein [Tanacetum cinerariifolium]